MLSKINASGCCNTKALIQPSGKGVCCPCTYHSRLCMAHIACLAASVAHELPALLMCSKHNICLSPSAVYKLHTWLWERTHTGSCQFVSQAACDWHAILQAIRRQLPPPEGPCQASPSGQPRQPSPCSAPAHTATKTPPSKPAAKCIAPEQYVAADEIFKVPKHSF